jgi:hypothetical protein
MSKLLRNFNIDQNACNILFGFIVVTSMLGLVYFAYIDASSRPVFLEVAKLVIAAFLGWMIPKQ